MPVNQTDSRPEKKSIARLAGTAAMMLVLTGCQTVNEMETGSTPVVQKKAVHQPATKVKAKKTKVPTVKPVVEKRPQDLWERIRRGLALKLDNNHPWVMTELRWYAKNQGYFNRVADRSAPYLYFIIKEAEERGVPLELALMPVVESAYDPFAYSHAGASGLWQFMPATGADYGLEQNWWYDGRRDVVAATRAALDYMARLHKSFGDWELALAAFNSGPGRVQRAINKNRKQGKPTTFWHLGLPRETTAYVPKLIALGKIVRNPEKYGISLKPVPNKPYFARVKTGGQLDMAKAAELSGVPLNELYRLNPGLNRWSTPPEGPNHLLVPLAKAEPFRKKLAKLPTEDRLRWKRYTVKSGDSLSTIARRYDTRSQLIREVNKMNGDMIRTGQSLLIPVPANGKENYTLTASQRRKAQQNSSVSGRYKVSYTVKSGDSFWTISRQFKVGINELARWNNMAPRDTLRVGQKLAVWSKGSGNSDSIIRKVNYTVRSGDSLSRIADRFNVRVHQIENWNNFASKYIHPGQLLTLYVDVTRAYD
ncbi:lytic transglycosylase [Endozoicomonas euniceicola]|uniref:LysM peptidoglycan-binding domain-containing protein n=1 Tax=Endozoicomonas euniceicola TaxID=1234143 RepID=A0ABY6GST5_9GAMM|nr:LysM peptidoglycan-binding domain-containing protein [Endozoicomonas euniceicola]UYM15813.1 LysM peptidoglycan-binding domain-containing protein [Endozoicomonas euniceicola]